MVIVLPVKVQQVQQIQQHEQPREGVVPTTERGRSKHVKMGGAMLPWHHANFANLEGGWLYSLYDSIS